MPLKNNSVNVVQNADSTKRLMKSASTSSHLINTRPPPPIQDESTTIYRVHNTSTFRRKKHYLVIIVSVFWSCRYKGFGLTLRMYVCYLLLDRDRVEKILAWLKNKATMYRVLKRNSRVFFLGNRQPLRNSMCISLKVSSTSARIIVRLHSWIYYNVFRPRNNSLLTACEYIN